jgi:hypothetical protein
MPDYAPAYKGYRVYPRGFLGASLGEQIKPSERSFSSQIKSHTYHPDWFQGKSNPKEVNKNIEAIWRHLNDGYHAVDNMEYREKVLRIALNAFGTKDFYEWVLIQINGPSTGDLHLRFLQDTFEFIETGKRSMSLHSWTALLSMSDITHNDTSNEGQFNWFFVTGDKRPKNMSVIDVIQRWCGQPNGFADLIQTLHVLFGEV